MPHDLNNKLFQFRDAESGLAVTTQMILCKLIGHFAMALCNVIKYFVLFLEIQKSLLIPENSESKLITVNLRAIGAFSTRRWSKIVA